MGESKFAFEQRVVHYRGNPYSITFRRQKMYRGSRFVDRAARIVTGVALGAISLHFFALGVTFLPIIGVVIAIPMTGLALFFLNSKTEFGLLPEEEKEAPEEGIGHLTDSLPGKAA
jgi:hypothetical protein